MVSLSYTQKNQKKMTAAVRVYQSGTYVIIIHGLSTSP